MNGFNTICSPPPLAKTDLPYNALNRHNSLAQIVIVINHIPTAQCIFPWRAAKTVEVDQATPPIFQDDLKLMIS